MRQILAMALAVWLSFGLPARADDLTGIAHVIDGDTIDVGTVRVRLHGIDAPEWSQVCTGWFASPWRCGQTASRYLARLAEGREVHCPSHRGRDRYGRTIAVFYLGDVDLNRAMVASGLAWAFRRYSLDYVEVENQARSARLGIWYAPNTTAEGHRLAQRQRSTP